MPVWLGGQRTPHLQRLLDSRAVFEKKKPSVTGILAGVAAGIPLACIFRTFFGPSYDSVAIQTSLPREQNFPESTAEASASKKGSLAHTAHIHHAAVYTALTPLTYTAPQHLHRSPCRHHSTYTADIHHATALTSLALHTPQGTTPRLFSIFPSF